MNGVKPEESTQKEGVHKFENICPECCKRKHMQRPSSALKERKEGPKMLKVRKPVNLEEQK
jgi:hypothetical protein